MNGIIYRATNKLNDKKYVGQTIYTLAKRRAGHKWAANENGGQIRRHKNCKK